MNNGTQTVGIRTLEEKLSEPKSSETSLERSSSLLARIHPLFRDGYVDESFSKNYLHGNVKKSAVVVDKYTFWNQVMRYFGCIKNPKEVAKEDIAHFNLVYDTGNHPKNELTNSFRHSTRFRYSRWRYAPFAIRRKYDGQYTCMITYQGRAAGFISFDIIQEGRGYNFMIKQLQGVGRRLSPFKWERALVAYVVAFAKKYDIPEVVIQSAQNNYWAEKTFSNAKQMGIYADQHFTDAVKDNPENRASEQVIQKLIKKTPWGKYRFHILPRQAYMLYDVTARRSGFRRDDVTGNYRLNLQQSIIQ